MPKHAGLRRRVQWSGGEWSVLRAMMEIDCPYRTDAESCEIVDAGVGEIVIIPHDPTDPYDACSHCIKSVPNPENRKTSQVVLHWIHGQRMKRGLPSAPPPSPVTAAAARREYKARPNIADEMLAVAKTVPKIAPAPVVAVAEDRLAICTDCDKWSVTNQRCKAACNCTNRPRPLDDKGKDCPLRKWRRS
jgi:hypothetical protein